MRSWNLWRTIIPCRSAEVLKSKNSQGKSTENTCFPILVDAICHLFAGMCPPTADTGSLPPCDPLVGLKAYSPERRTQYTIPHLAALHDLSKSACSFSVLQAKKICKYFILFKFIFRYVSSSQSTDAELLTSLYFRSHVQVLHPEHVWHRGCRLWVSTGFISVETRLMFSEWCQNRWN